MNIVSVPMFTIEGIPFAGVNGIPRDVGMVCKVGYIKINASLVMFARSSSAGHLEIAATC